LSPLLDLIMIFLAIETLDCHTSGRLREPRSQEAAFKYFMLKACRRPFSSTVLPRFTVP
jgi:hypothetical protein